MRDTGSAVTGAAVRERVVIPSQDRVRLDDAPPFRADAPRGILLRDRSSTAFDGEPMAPRGLGGGPRYELRVVRGEGADAPILVWTRHRSLFLARLSKRMEEATPRFGAARLVLWDTRTCSVVE